MKTKQSRVRLFSVRQGFVPEKAPFQGDSLDDDLRRLLWNALFTNVLSQFQDGGKPGTEHQTKLFRVIALDYLEQYAHLVDEQFSIDLFELVLDELQSIFDHDEWYRVFDVIEYIIMLAPQYDIDTTGFIDDCNAVLEKECSVYRVVEGKLVRAWEPPVASPIK